MSRASLLGACAPEPAPASFHLCQELVRVFTVTVPDCKQQKLPGQFKKEMHWKDGGWELEMLRGGWDR